MGITPGYNAATALPLVGDGLQVAKPFRLPSERQSLFSPQNRLFLPRRRNRRHPRGPSVTGRRTCCPLLPTPPLRCDSLHLSFQLSPPSSAQADSKHHSEKEEEEGGGKKKKKYIFKKIKGSCRGGERGRGTKRDFNHCSAPRAPSSCPMCPGGDGRAKGRGAWPPPQKRGAWAQPFCRGHASALHHIEAHPPTPAQPAGAGCRPLLTSPPFPNREPSDSPRQENNPPCSPLQPSATQSLVPPHCTETPPRSPAALMAGLGFSASA